MSHNYSSMWNSTHAWLSTVPCTVRKPLHRTSWWSDQRKELWRMTSAHSTVTHVTDQQWVKVHLVASPRKAKQRSKGSPRQLFLFQRNHTNHLILQDWNPRSQHRTNQNHHQLDQKCHTRHLRALRPNKITLPRC